MTVELGQAHGLRGREGMTFAHVQDGFRGAEGCQLQAIGCAAGACDHDVEFAAAQQRWGSVGPDVEQRNRYVVAWSELTSLAADGKLEVVVAATFDLAQAAEASELTGTGHAGGKVVLVP